MTDAGTLAGRGQIVLPQRRCDLIAGVKVQPQTIGLYRVCQQGQIVRGNIPAKAVDPNTGGTQCARPDQTFGTGIFMAGQNHQWIALIVTLLVLENGVQFAVQPVFKHRQDQLWLGTGTQFLQYRHQTKLVVHRDRISRKTVVQQVFHARLVERQNGVVQAFLVLQPFIGMCVGHALGGSLVRHGLLQQHLDLPDRIALFQPVQNLANCIHLTFAVKAVPFRGTVRLDNAVSAFPGSQRRRIDSGKTSKLTNRIAASCQIVHSVFLRPSSYGWGLRYTC